MTLASSQYATALRPADEAPTATCALIDVVIVTARGSWDLLDDCLRSLRANRPRHGAITVQVIDNASRDGLVEKVARHHPDVVIEEMPGNLGFACACNVGIRRSGAPFVLLLNPDTVIPPRALDRLLETMWAHPRTAVAGPRLVGTDGRTDHNAKRAFPTASAALAHFVPMLRRWLPAAGDYKRVDIPELGTGAVDAVSGSCMLVRRDAIAKVGLLDEGYWMYGEDLDWCRRFGALGWEIRYAGSATVVHVKYGLTGRHRALRTNWAFHRSMGRFYRRFEAGPRPLLDAAVYAGVVLRFGASASVSALQRRRGGG